MLFDDTWSQEGHSVIRMMTFSAMYDHTLVVLANHQIGHQATRNVGCQGGDYRWPSNLPQGPVDRVLDSRSEGLGFNSHCWLCVEVLGKLLISYCICPPSSDGYLAERKLENYALNSPPRR